MSNKEIELIKNESLGQKLIKKWFWLYFFSYLSAPLWYVIRVIISNSPDVSVSEFWVLYGIISLITLLYTYNDLWLTESLQYFLPRFYFRKQFDNIKTTVYLSLFVEIVTWLIISLWLRFGSDWLAVHYFESEIAGEVLRYFCFYFMGTNLLQVIQTIFKSFQKTFEFQLIEFVKVLFIAIFTVFFFFFEWNIQNYSLSRLWWMAIAIIFAMILYVKYRRHIMKWKFKVDKDIFKQYTKYALWAFIGSNIRNLFWQIILQMVIYILWVESAWYYSNFLSLFSIASYILWPIMLLIFPITSECFEKSDKLGINYLMSVFYSYFSVFVLSLSILFIVLWSEMAFVLYWEKFILSWKLLSIAWFFLIFNLLSSFNYKVLSWLWKVKEKLLITAISLIVAIVLAYVWINLWWLYWATIAFGVSSLFNWRLGLCFIKKWWYSCNMDWKYILKNCIFLIFLWVVIYLLKIIILSYFNISRMYLVIYLICIGLFFYFFFLLFNRKKIQNFISIK